MEGKVSVCGKLEFAVLYISGYDSAPHTSYGRDALILRKLVNMDALWPKGDDDQRSPGIWRICAPA